MVDAKRWRFTSKPQRIAAPPCRPRSLTELKRDPSDAAGSALNQSAGSGSFDCNLRN